MSEMSASEKKKEDWMNSKWRPMMGWVYMLVCLMDFVVFPIAWSIIQTIGGGRVETQWSPITLQGAGLFHMAMGAVLGLAAFGRTQEKLAGANNGGLAQPTTFGIPTPTSGNIQATTSTSGFDSTSTAGSTNSSGTGSILAKTAGGKTIVPQGPQPEL